MRTRLLSRTDGAGRFTLTDVSPQTTALQASATSYFTVTH
jgi:hypothetical protein